MEDTDRPRRLLPRRHVLTELLAHRGPFWADSSVELRLRTYNFTRKIDGTTVSDATALGTELTFHSGRWKDRLSFLATWHTSLGLHTPDDLGGTGILGPDQSDLSVLSRAYTEIHLTERASARLYRQDFTLPYLNRDDSRMIPNTHEAYIVRRPGDRFEFLAGYVTKIKRRESESFLHMGEVAGVSGSKAGTAIFSGRANPTERVSVDLTGLYTEDLLSTVYAETSYKRALDERWGLQLAAQYSWQGSQGEERRGDAEHDDELWNVQVFCSHYCDNH